MSRSPLFFRSGNYPSTNSNYQDDDDVINNSINNTGEKYESTVLQQENEDEYSQFASDVSKVCPYGCCKRTSLSDHVFGRGLLEGKYSDVTIEVFEMEYKLHKLFLDKSGYFRSLFNWKDDDESDEDDLELENKINKYSVTFDDEYITKESFELALSRLYGSPNYTMEQQIPHNMIAIGSYLDINDVICTSTEVIIQSMTMSNVVKFLKFATTNHYGPASDRIIGSAKGILCSLGWEHGVLKWDGIPEDVIADVVGEDCFFVPNEWDRCMFIIKLIERRTTKLSLNELSDNLSVSSANSMVYDLPVSLLRKVLREKVYYCHLSAEQLQQLSDFNDINGIPYIDLNVLHEALWQSTSLQRTIVKSLDLPNLGMAISSDNEQVGANKGWYRVPVRDETICGTPPQLKKLMSEHQFALANTDTSSSINEGEFKATGGIESSASDDTKIYSWTKLPPFRFSIAFANASDLSTEKRVYAKTLWYAGSYWNLYLQKVKVKQKKGFQMGVYLHRASTLSSTSRNGLVNPDVYGNNINYMDPPIQYSDDSVGNNQHDTIPLNPSAEFSDNDEKENIDDDTLLSYLDNLDLTDVSNKDLRHSYSSNTVKQQQGPIPNDFTPNSQTQFNVGATSSQQNQRSFLCYDDTRSKISVYFVISTPSRRAKSTITSFVSAPDTFNKSQSWGWKSNSMCVFNDDGTFPDDHEKHLKFMVVLGNI